MSSHTHSACSQAGRVLGTLAPVAAPPMERQCKGQDGRRGLAGLACRQAEGLCHPPIHRRIGAAAKEPVRVSRVPSAKVPEMREGWWSSCLNAPTVRVIQMLRLSLSQTRPPWPAAARSAQGRSRCGRLCCSDCFAPGERVILLPSVARASACHAMP